MKRNTGISKGVGFVGVLQGEFIVMKLCGVINWSWWCVLCPSILVVGLLLIGLIASLIIVLHEK